MIRARKRPAFNFLLRPWMTRVVRRRFHNVYLVGGEHLKALDRSQPVVGCVNHTNWWDGFILYLLSDRWIGHEVYLPMEEENLRRYRFMRWMGAFGMDLSRPQAALAGVRYAVRLLRETSGGRGNLVWMFGQGKLLRPSVPVEIKGGAALLARRAGASLLPVTIRYEWLGESRPSVFINVGDPMSADTSTELLAGCMNDLLADTDRALDIAALEGYIPWFSPGLSINKRWDQFLNLLSRRGGRFDTQNNFPR